MAFPGRPARIMLPASRHGGKVAMLTRQQVQDLYPRAPAAHLDELAAQSGPVFGQFGIAPGNRLNFFLAQVGHESGGMTITEENMNYRAERIVEVWPSRFPTVESARPFANKPEKLANSVYANRMGNGGPQSGDGFRYRGRGYIQITGRGAYRDIGGIVGLDLERSPELAGAPAHALKVACGFWAWKGLNALCDGGDYVAVTRRINGGTNGMADRRAWLDKVLRLFAAPPAAESVSAAEAIAIQRALQRAGFPEVGAADGIIGPRTLAGIARFRLREGLPPGGVDNALKKALGLA
jgi:putative chitinase